MLRKIVSGIRLAGKSVGETGAVVDVGRGVGAPRQRDDRRRRSACCAGRDRADPKVEKRKIGQAAVDESAGPRDLVGIGEMKLGAMGDAGRAQREFPSADDRVLNGEREEKIGFADVVVIEEI